MVFLPSPTASNLPPTAAAPPPAGVQQQFLPGPGSVACGQAWSNTTAGGAAASAPTPAVVDCGAFTIASISFAFYGNPQGSCWAATKGACNAANAQSFVQSSCVGKAFCIIVRRRLFPCHAYAASSLFCLQCRLS